MFKKFEGEEHVSGVNNVKSSVQRNIKTKILEQYPHLVPYFDQIIAKKEAVRVAKCHEHIELVLGKDGEVLFYRQREGPFFPTLRLLHKYPFMVPHMQVDRGAIKFLLSGANIMCPGLTSPGARMTDLEADTVVAIMAEGKEHALSVGYTKMSSQKILDVNKGIGVDNIHYLNDGLWRMRSIK